MAGDVNTAESKTNDEKLKSNGAKDKNSNPFGALKRNNTKKVGIDQNPICVNCF